MVRERHHARTFAFVFIAFVSTSLFAAQRTREDAAGALQVLRAAAGNDVRVRLDDQGVAAFVEAAPGKTIPIPGAPAPNARERATAFVRVYAKLFGLRNDADVVVSRVAARDHAGMEHVRMRQVVNGVPVAGTSLSVHLRDHGIVRIFSKTAPDAVIVDTRPSIQASAAVQASNALVTKYRGAGDVTLSQPRLEILQKSLIDARDKRPPMLAWFVEATKPGVREFIWIDARRGATLLHFNQVAHAKVRQVYDANDLGTLPGTLVRSEGGPATGDADADNAYEFSGDTYDYFFTEHGRDSYDGAGGVLTSSVHYCEDDVCPTENAYWDGSQMLYGEGYAADDVTAHELTHAVTQYTAGLYYYMQAGALNESYSDVFGETVDLINGAGSDDPEDRWLIAEDIPGGAIRDMMDPGIYDQPGKMSDPNFFCDINPQIDGGGLHFNSGVPNHAFALMVDGGTYNSYTITAIGLTKAGKIHYRALTTYLDQASNFIDNYNALLSSCADLTGQFGISTSDCAEVKKALDAVEMSDVWGCTTESNVPPALCSAGGAIDTAFFDLENIGATSWSSHIIDGDDQWGYGFGTGGIYWDEWPKSGNYSFWGFPYSFGSQSFLRNTSAIAVTSDMRMQFAHSFSFETDYDGGVIEVSTNGGSSWEDAGSLISAGAAYNGVVFFDTANRSVFNGDSYGYTATQLDLSSLAGQNLLFRFHMFSDTSVGDLGWFIDDIRFYRCVAIPTNVVATAASSTSVNITWTAAAGASSYRVYRSSNGVAYSLVGSPATNSFTDNTASANTAYLYKVRAFNGTESPDSNVDLATTVIFTDPTLTTSTLIKAVHFTQLLTAVNAVRTLAGLSAVSFTAPTPTTSVTVRTAHLQNLRDGIYPALSALDRPLTTYTDGTITAGVTTVKKTHVEQLRADVQ